MPTVKDNGLVSYYLLTDSAEIMANHTLRGGYAAAICCKKLP
jgi:hypothetical protein